jgi:N-acetyl-anhydromuramyl-L-alanine amidase AmpD
MADGTYRAELAKKTFKPSEVVVAGHRNSPHVVIGWDDYPVEQINASIDIMAAIVAKYGIKENNVVGHDDIAPIRKVDPGPAYPLARVKSAAFGRK